VSANGSAAVFLRDVANIRMDMTDIEIFNLKALGGTDTITVDNLDGTAVRHANIDVSGSSGGIDQQADVVTVNGTNRPDRVNVTAQDGQIDISGLPADTQITGSETLDQLQVDTLDGNDTVNVAPDVSTLIGVAVDLGLGLGTNTYSPTHRSPFRRRSAWFGCDATSRGRSRQRRAQTRSVRARYAHLVS
jgi:hypothetical protein